MKKSKINKILNVLLICTATIEIGIFIGCYILLNTNFNKYNVEYKIKITK